MVKVAYFDCYSGISGDMTVAAFLDAGLRMAILRKELKKLKLKGYEIGSRKVKRGSLVGTKFDCVIKDRACQRRSLKAITGLIEKSALSKRVKNIAVDIFKNIGKAEAKIHGVRRSRGASFHELGDMDSIVDIVGAAIAIDELGIDEVYSSAVNTGRTVVKTAHGNLPVPAPASLELLKDIPLKISDISAELVTPTGAGILKTLSRGFERPPQIKPSAIGYGAGAYDLKEIPNMLRVIIGQAEASAFTGDRVLVIEANIDDMNPQYFEYVFERLFDKGALDVYIQNIYMKKTRPAFKLTVLAEPRNLKDLASIIFSETTTLGVRFHEVERFTLGRKIVRVKTKYGEVPVKFGTLSAGAFTASPEYDGCAKIAREKKVPLKVVYDEARKAVTGFAKGSMK